VTVNLLLFCPAFHFSIRDAVEGVLTTSILVGTGSTPSHLFPLPATTEGD